METVFVNLKDINGDIKIKYTGIYDEKISKIMFLFWQIQEQNEIFVAGIVFEMKEKNIVYISILDSTGEFKPRNMQKGFINGTILALLKYLSPTFLEVFSQPKKEIIFGKSSKNTKKGFLNSHKLFKYWKNIFSEYICCENKKEYKLYIHNNTDESNGIPYHRNTKLNDIYLFDDDPKQKLINNLEENVDIYNFFSILLFRSDFSNGSLLFNVCPCKKHNSNINLEEFNLFDIKEILETLRGLDFSDYQNSLKSTIFFLKKYQLKSFLFKTSKSKLSKNIIEKPIEEQSFVKIKTKSKK
ncbi:putative histone acetylation protein [Hamiltosporidium tvaerminnensis]|uniref:histone acetyltransferase n=1 Tax=Hamiltosporidium tvaerminnensis TaxID=1176355 RepID=A0A4V2JXW5_9MICR|nr:putative histone acetylation protein [Hamiltosporidium tvaerminnensis]